MSGTLNKFRKRNIQANLYQFILVIFVVAVSVCLISGLFISHLTLKNSLDKFYTQSNLPNLWLETTGLTESDEVFLSKYNYTKRYSFYSDFKVGSGTYNSKFLVAGRKTATPYIVEGDTGLGCYVDASFIEKYGIGIGASKIILDFSAYGETKSIELLVLGSLAMAEDLVIDDECLIFIDERVLLQVLKQYFSGIDETDFSVINYNQVLITSEISSENKQEILDYFSSSTTSLISMKTQDDIASFVTLKKELKISETMLWFFPILFVIISILVIISSISQLVLKERYNIGLLKSLGFSNKKLVSNYSGYGAFICFFGAIFGFIFSPLIIPNITFETYDKLYNLPKDEVKMAVPILLIFLVIVVAVLIGYLTAFCVISKIVKGTPKECMAGNVKIKLKSRNKPRKLNKILGGALNNIKINKARSIMSFVAIFGGLVLIEIGFGVNLSFVASGFLSIKAFSSIFKGFSITLLLVIVMIFGVQIFKERQKEMVMQRILGESYLKIWLSVVLEMLLVTAASFVLSCLLCQPIFMLLLKIFGISGKFYVNFLGFLYSFIIVLALEIPVFLAGLVKLHKLDLSSSIKFSE